MKKAILIMAAAGALLFAGLAGATAQGLFKMAVGDHAVIKGTHIACGISRNSTTATAITCFKRRGTKTVVGSYAVQVGDKYAALLRVTSTNGDTKPIAIKTQP